MAIIDEGFEYASGISEEGVTQAGFKPGAQALGPFFGKTLRDSCEEGFGFAVALLEGFFLEFFLEASTPSPAEAKALARCCREFSVTSAASFTTSSSKC